MKYYELTLLIDLDVSEEEIKSIQEKINATISKNGGILNETNLPIRKNLSRSIERKREALIFDIDFHLEPSKIEDLAKELKTEKKILRYLILSKKAEKTLKTKAIRRRIRPKRMEITEIDQKLDEILKE